MRLQRGFTIRFSLLLCALLLLVANGMAQKKSKYACAEPNPQSLCLPSNTCGSATGPCVVNINKEGGSASATAETSDKKKNGLFCVKVGTGVTFMSSNKNTGFVLDFGPKSPFDPDDPIIGGGKNQVTVKAQNAGCYKYSIGACYSGATYGMCGNSSSEAIVVP
jgi:hypothetical protein